MASNKTERSAVSLRSAAVSGALWSGLQMVVNKATALVGTLVSMYLLNPEAFGVAAVAASILAYVTLLPAITLSDVLLARPETIASRLAPATRLCVVTTALSVVSLLAVGFLWAERFSDQGIWHACLCLSVRPVGELLLLGPQTLLRARLDFKRLSQIDAIAQVASTVATVVMAAAGLGFFSLVIPPGLAVFARALMYARVAGANILQIGRRDLAPHSTRELLRDYGLSGLGQYVHGGLIMSPPLILGAYYSTDVVGCFSTAFALSASFNVVVAVGLGLVLQPVFARMGNDRSRQQIAFVRTSAVIAAVSMPVCVCQSLCVAPVFRLIMPPSWSSAIIFAQLLSLGQSMYFIVNPAMGLLKAQGRFMAFFIWQAVQLAVVSCLMVVCGNVLSDDGVGVVAIFSFYHIVFSPIGLALCIPIGDGFVYAIRQVVLGPLAATALALTPVALAATILEVSGWRDLALVIAACGSILLLYPQSLRICAPVVYCEAKDLVFSLLRRKSSNAPQQAS